jgi:hypothetical protein
MGDVDPTIKKPRILRSEAKSIGVRKQYYKTEEKQEKLRERISLLQRQKEEIEKKILDLEKFIIASPEN